MLSDVVAMVFCTCQSLHWPMTHNTHQHELSLCEISPHRIHTLNEKHMWKRGGHIGNKCHNAKAGHSKTIHGPWKWFIFTPWHGIMRERNHWVPVFTELPTAWNSEGWLLPAVNLFSGAIERIKRMGDAVQWWTLEARQTICKVLV